MSSTGSGPEKFIKPEDRLIVALDVSTADEARSIVDELAGLAGAFKIGLQLFTAAGPKFVAELCDGGSRIFLDLKFHDIPNTVAKAAVEAARLGVWMLNVHASGGREMMAQALAEVNDFCTAYNRPRPLIIGVTVLTSSDVYILKECGVETDVESQVVRLTQLAKDSGLDGVVASAREAEIIRSALPEQDVVVVTPGIRPSNATKDDQKRVMTPGSAISSGADYLVVGRPIIASRDRREAAKIILDEIGETQ